MTLDRRTFLASAAALLAPSSLRAQEIAQDGFRIIRPRPLPDDPLGRLSYTDAETPAIIRIRKGEELKVRLINGLGRETTIHWRGVRGVRDVRSRG